MHIIFTYLTSYNVLVRYTLPVLPLLLITAADGLAQIKNKTVIALFIIINILGIISLTGAPHIKRPDGYKTLADTLTKSGVSQNYNFIMPIRANLLDKYFYIKGHTAYINLQHPRPKRPTLTKMKLKVLIRIRAIKTSI